MLSTVQDAEDRKAKNGPILMRSCYYSRYILIYTTNDRTLEYNVMHAIEQN